MEPIVELHRSALDEFARRVDAVRADQWDAPSCCEGWDVRELVNHVVTGNLWAGELAAGATIDEVGDRLDGDVLGDDPSAACRRSNKIAGDVFAAPGALEAPCAVSYGPVPGEVYLGHRFIDLVVHGWDLAASTGQDTTIPAPLVDMAWQVVEPQLDMLAASGAFAAPIDAGSDADPQARLLAALGRQPA